MQAVEELKDLLEEWVYTEESDSEGGDLEEDRIEEDYADNARYEEDEEDERNL